jgi:hypothetical protein
MSGGFAQRPRAADVREVPVIHLAQAWPDGEG